MWSKVHVYGSVVVKVPLRDHSISERQWFAKETRNQIIATYTNQKHAIKKCKDLGEIHLLDFQASVEIRDNYIVFRGADNQEISFNIYKISYLGLINDSYGHQISFIGKEKTTQKRKAMVFSLSSMEQEQIFQDKYLQLRRNVGNEDINRLSKNPTENTLNNQEDDETYGVNYNRSKCIQLNSESQSSTTAPNNKNSITLSRAPSLLRQSLPLPPSGTKNLINDQEPSQIHSLYEHFQQFPPESNNYPGSYESFNVDSFGEDNPVSNEATNEAVNELITKSKNVICSNSVSESDITNVNDLAKEREANSENIDLKPLSVKDRVDIEELRLNAETNDHVKKDVITERLDTSRILMNESNKILSSFRQPRNENAKKQDRHFWDRFKKTMTIDKESGDDNISIDSDQYRYIISDDEYLSIDTYYSKQGLSAIEQEKLYSGFSSSSSDSMSKFQLNKNSNIHIVKFQNDEVNYTEMIHSVMVRLSEMEMNLISANKILKILHETHLNFSEKIKECNSVYDIFNNLYDIRDELAPYVNFSSNAVIIEKIKANDDSKLLENITRIRKRLLYYLQYVDVYSKICSSSDKEMLLLLLEALRDLNRKSDSLLILNSIKACPFEIGLYEPLLRHNMFKASCSESKLNKDTYRLFLFKELIVICKDDIDTYKYVDHIRFEQAMVVNSQLEKVIKLREELGGKKGKRTFIIGGTKTLKNEWMDNIEELIHAYAEKVKLYKLNQLILPD